MKKVELYISKHVLYYILVTFVVFAGILFLIKFTDNLRLLNENYSFIFSLFTVFLNSLPEILILFPAIVLLGVMLGLGYLANTHELPVIQTSGISKLQIAFTVVKAIIPLILLQIFCREYIIPSTQNYAKQIQGQISASNNFTFSRNGVWTKDKNVFIYLKKFISGQEAKLQQIRLYSFNDKNELVSITEAENADYKNTYWLLRDVAKLEVNKKQITKQKIEDQKWYTSITPKNLAVASINPASMKTKELFHYKNYLKETGQNYKGVEIEIWRNLLQPLTIITMLFLGISFIFGSTRSTSSGHKIFIGVVCGFGFYLLGEACSKLSLITELPTSVAAIIPNLFFLTLSIYILIYKQG